MQRRSFLRHMAGGAALLGLGSIWPNKIISAYAQEASFPDLVAVRGTNLPAMFDRALTALGGLSRFVKSGQTVLIKPNMAWAVGPEVGANTNPLLISHMIKNVLNIGAKKVYVFDNTCDNWASAYRESGLEAAASEAGATVAPANTSAYFQEVTIPGAKYLTEMSYHEIYLEADVIINVPVLKHHGGAKMTAAMKNLMGVIWSRGPFHRSGLDGTIPELLLYKKPSLHVVEAVRVMLNGGPRGYGDSRYLASQMLLASTDPVAIDAASAAIVASSGITVPNYIRVASELGLGVADLTTLNIQRLTI